MCEKLVGWKSLFKGGYTMMVSVVIHNDDTTEDNIHW